MPNVDGHAGAGQVDFDFGDFPGGLDANLLPGLPNLPLRLTVEPLTALLSVLVAAVGTLVLLYAVGYMQREPGRVRFFALMSAFVAAMQTLVLAGDWLLLLAAWELIGLCSYLLIGFWFQRPEAAGAASRAFLYTRTADLGLYLAVFVIIGRSGSSEIATSLGAGGSAILGAGLLVAAMGKSAQVPLQDWLMRAMAGPTPVSALLHSATLVAAGAILLIRAAPLLSHETLLAVGIVGGITTVITGLIALAERDLKRALAASTASQYGLMLVAVGAGVPVAALLHLIAHAAIKSSLFLGAGVFQHARGGTAFARLEGVGRARPRMFFGFVVAALALVGVPPLSGFFTKDAI
ncbi:MAG TPA: proton-conducting transporter membrane subunit, partial [Wenzhouxiangella sp.]|nr:proton-conducting transporter membrane subunit [Wenzhouxiangella sp.]